MARKSIEERLAQLDAQRASLKARLGKQERANDTRRKVLLGALVLHRLEIGKDDFSRNLNEWLRRELPVLPDGEVGDHSQPDGAQCGGDLYLAPHG